MVGLVVVGAVKVVVGHPPDLELQAQSKDLMEVQPPQQVEVAEVVQVKLADLLVVIQQEQVVMVFLHLLQEQAFLVVEVVQEATIPMTLGLLEVLEEEVLEQMDMPIKV
tara:strand:+ start:54 stop:380 length:327 start_codon:yes stop_codon:yes gene_type:complete